MLPFLTYARGKTPRRAHFPCPSPFFYSRVFSPPPRLPPPHFVPYSHPKTPSLSCSREKPLRQFQASRTGKSRGGQVQKLFQFSSSLLPVRESLSLLACRAHLAAANFPPRSSALGSSASAAVSQVFSSRSTVKGTFCCKLNRASRLCSALLGRETVP